MTPEELRKVIERDRAARAAFVVKFGPVLRGVVRFVRSGWVRPAHDEEDLLQNVFLEIFRNDSAALRGWDPAGGRSLETFLRYFAKYRVIDQLRPRNRDLPTDGVEIAKYMDGAVATRKTDEPDWIEAALSRYRVECSDDDWRFVEQVIGEGSTEDLAVAFGISVEAVYKRKSRFRQRLLDLKKELQ